LFPTLPRESLEGQRLEAPFARTHTPPPPTFRQTRFSDSISLVISTYLKTRISEPLILKKPVFPTCWPNRPKSRGGPCRTSLWEVPAQGRGAYPASAQNAPRRCSYDDHLLVLCHRAPSRYLHCSQPPSEPWSRNETLMIGAQYDISICPHPSPSSLKKQAAGSSVLLLFDLEPPLEDGKIKGLCRISLRHWFPMGGLCRALSPYLASFAPASLPRGGYIRFPIKESY